ncbi:MAG: hypothetical protein ACT4PU_09955 [Planctomycetota bacterium]
MDNVAVTVDGRPNSTHMVVGPDDLRARETGARNRRAEPGRGIEVRPALGGPGRAPV